MLCPDGLDNTLLSQVCILETAPTVGTVGRMYISRRREGDEKLLIAQAQHTGHNLLMTYSNRGAISFLRTELVAIIICIYNTLYS